MITLNKEDAFTIVDIISKAQEIVRCKDCEYWRETHDNDHQGNHSVIMECYYDQWHPQYRDADDYCSRGEKK